MSSLRTAAQDYLAMRRALGFKLGLQGRLLMQFIDYVIPVPPSSARSA